MDSINIVGGPVGDDLFGIDRVEECLWTKPTTPNLLDDATPRQNMTNPSSSMPTHTSPNPFMVTSLANDIGDSLFTEHPPRKGITVSTQSDATRQRFKALKDGRDCVLAAKAKKDDATPTKTQMAYAP